MSLLRFTYKSIQFSLHFSKFIDHFIVKSFSTTFYLHLQKFLFIEMKTKLFNRSSFCECLNLVKKIISHRKQIWQAKICMFAFLFLSLLRPLTIITCFSFSCTQLEGNNNTVRLKPQLFFFTMARTQAEIFLLFFL